MFIIKTRCFKKKLGAVTRSVVHHNIVRNGVILRSNMYGVKQKEECLLFNHKVRSEIIACTFHDKNIL